MRAFVTIASFVLVTTLCVMPASAYVLNVTTSVSLTGVQNEAALKGAVQSAVEDVLKKAAEFIPTLAMITDAVVVGDRLYIRVLIADADGEQLLNDQDAVGDDMPEGTRPSSPDLKRELRTKADDGASGPVFRGRRAGA